MGFPTICDFTRTLALLGAAGSGLTCAATVAETPAGAPGAPGPGTVAASPRKPLALALREPTGSVDAKVVSPLLQAMKAELERSVRELPARGSEKPYYLGYQVIETERADVSASLGGLSRSVNETKRNLEVDLRVGDKGLDNTHQIRTDELFSARYYRTPAAIPLEDDPAAIRAAIWYETDRRYQEAVRKLDEVRANRAVKAEEEDLSGDFTDEPPQSYVEAPAKLAFDKAQWERRIRRYSEYFKSFPDIYKSEVTLAAETENKYLVSSESTLLQTGRTRVRLSFMAETRAVDGQELRRYEWFDVAGFDRLPGEAAIAAKMKQVADDVVALRKAPLMDPYTGPAILEGRSAGVFFHETLGHRLEGHRQKRDVEGQTFAKKVGEKVMPDFVDVYDDPRIRSIGTTDLNGHYTHDDEGVRAQRASLVEGGVLKTFLMSRSPTRGVTRSNGHGRRSPGYQLVARQANLVVEPRETFPPDELRRRLVAEAKRQGKPFGLVFKELEGGFTSTWRFGTQGFKVLPVMVYKVPVDGGADVLVRGADLVGTPLSVLTKIVAAGDDHQTFNGVCGAESGGVPVSATAPSLLIEQVEVTKKFKEDERPPVLPPPPPKGDAAPRRQP